MAFYFDTSALVKLVLAEAESDVLVDWLNAEEPDVVSSDLARAELPRAVARNHPDAPVRAGRLLESIELLPLTVAAFTEAGRIGPATLRTLDAIHLATALRLGSDLEGIVAYDDRLADAARRNGVAVLAPR